MSTQKGFSLIELLIVVAIILTIAAIAIPSLTRSRISANESSAVESLRILTTSEAAYQLAYQSYACNLTLLGPPPGISTPVSSATAGLIDATLASGSKSGYLFSPTACSAAGYSYIAQPMGLGNTGSRYFCTDSSGVIKYDGTSTAACLSGNRPV
jgi:type IV pilus assembly protein PilA